MEEHHSARQCRCAELTAPPRGATTDHHSSGTSPHGRPAANAPITATQIAAWTRRDPLMARVLRYVLQGRPNQQDDDLKHYWPKQMELSVESGCIVWGRRG